MIFPCRLIWRQRQCKRESTLMMKGRQRYNGKERKTREPWSSRRRRSNSALQKGWHRKTRGAAGGIEQNNLVQAHRQISNAIAR